MNRPIPRNLLACLLGASVLGLAAFTASAQVASAVTLDTATQAQVETGAVDATGEAAAPTAAPTAAQIELAAQRDADRNCLRYTGTRIIPRDRPSKQCVPQHGSVYTRDDLDRTGEVDIAQALRKLDTAIGW